MFVYVPEATARRRDNSPCVCSSSIKTRAWLRNHNRLTTSCESLHQSREASYQTQPRSANSQWSRDAHVIHQPTFTDTITMQNMATHRKANSRTDRHKGLSSTTAPFGQTHAILLLWCLLASLHQWSTCCWVLFCSYLGLVLWLVPMTRFHWGDQKCCGCPFSGFLSAAFAVCTNLVWTMASV